MADKIEQLNKFLLDQYRTQVMFSPSAAQDYKSFASGKRQDMLRLIVKQAEKGALFKPEGNANRCEGQLHDYAKIKSKNLNLRIIYKPIQLETGIIQMDIIAIGPRDNMQVYKKAIMRLQQLEP